jgi:aconitate hydratase
MTQRLIDPFGARAQLKGTDYSFYRLDKLRRMADIDRLPFSIKVLLEAVLRTADGYEVMTDDVERLARWSPQMTDSFEVPFKPGRVILQDFTGVPAVVDLAAMRAAMSRLGGNADRINPHRRRSIWSSTTRCRSISSARPSAFSTTPSVSSSATASGTSSCVGPERLRNFRVVPPAMGIVHQVNLEYLGQVVMSKPGGRPCRLPRHLVGTDSHTTMINGLGVLGWGVGGIEAEAVMLGQPVYMLTPEVVGLRLVGRLKEGTTATDLVLTVTEMLRKKGVVGKFVEFFGPGLSQHAAGRPRDHRQHVPGVRRTGRLLPDRRGDAALPAQHRPPGTSWRSGRALRQGAGPVPHRWPRPIRCSPTCWNWICHRRAEPGRPKRPQDRVLTQEHEGRSASNWWPPSGRAVSG